MVKGTTQTDRAETLERLAKRESLTEAYEAQVGEAIPTGESLSAEESTEIRKTQRERANLMALGLVCLCILFFLITIVKIGMWG